MTAEEIFAGESENIEFKSEIPAKSEKYMKTVVAFANGKGGKLVFGVENGTWAVTGFSKEEVFQKMDAITNSIFDSCEPVSYTHLYSRTDALHYPAGKTVCQHSEAARVARALYVLLWRNLAAGIRPCP